MSAGHEEVRGPPNLQVGGINGTDQRESLSDGRDFVAGRGLLDRVGSNFPVSGPIGTPGELYAGRRARASAGALTVPARALYRFLTSWARKGKNPGESSPVPC